MIKMLITLRPVHVKWSVVAEMLRECIKDKKIDSIGCGNRLIVREPGNVLKIYTISKTEVIELA